MSAKAFAITKEQLAGGGLCDAAGGAQIAEVYQIAPNSGARGPRGRNLAADEAHRIVALVRLGKRSILYRLGNDEAERVGAIDDLATMLERTRGKGGGRTFPFPKNIRECIAAVALEELKGDMCQGCSGAGQVPDHIIEQLEGRQPMAVCPTCMGTRRRRYNEDERVTNLAKAWIAQFPKQHDEDPAAVSIVATSLRKHDRLRQLLGAIDHAKGILIDTERVATEETARMIERM